MPLFKTSFIYRAFVFFVAGILSISAIALDFNQAQQLANQGNVSAQYSLGHMYYSGEGARQDYAKAVEWYTKAANQGDADAQYNLGVMYKNGEGVRQDYAKEMEWYTKAANQGLAQAQHNLGFMYKNGEGVRQDYAKAVEWRGYFLKGYI